MVFHGGSITSTSVVLAAALWALAGCAALPPAGVAATSWTYPLGGFYDDARQEEGPASTHVVLGPNSTVVVAFTLGTTTFNATFQPTGRNSTARMGHASVELDGTARFPRGCYGLSGSWNPDANGALGVFSFAIRGMHFTGGFTTSDPQEASGYQSFLARNHPTYTPVQAWHAPTPDPIDC
ncbi:MAG: hypothetical protein ACYDBQ_08350 [Thermoplasmatota archaeon]